MGRKRKDKEKEGGEKEGKKMRMKKKKQQKQNDDHVSRIKNNLFNGQLPALEDCEVLVDSMKTSKKEGINLFRKILSLFIGVRDLDFRVMLVEDIITPFLQTTGSGFGVEYTNTKSREVFREGQYALLECWDILLNTIEDSDHPDYRIRSYKAILAVVFRDDFDIYQTVDANNPTPYLGVPKQGRKPKSNQNTAEERNLEVFSHYIRLCYKTFFHIVIKLSDPNYKPNSPTLHFFTEVLAYLLLVLPSFPPIVLKGLHTNYQRQEEHLEALLQDPSVEIPEGIQLRQRVDACPIVEKHMKDILRANKRVSSRNFSRNLSLRTSAALKDSHRLVDYWTTLRNLIEDLQHFDETLVHLDNDLKNIDLYWVDRLFRKKDLYYALLQKFVNQTTKLLRCDTLEVDWGTVPIFNDLVRFFLVDMNNQSGIEYTALFLNTTKVLCRCGGMVSLLVQYLFSATSVFRPAAAISALQIVSLWFQGRDSLPPNFPLAFFYEALSICLSNEHFDVCFNALLLLYEHEHLFLRDNRSKVINELFLKFFWKFFLHWDSNIRCTFQRILLYKINGVLKFRKEDVQTTKIMNEAKKKRDVLITQIQLQLGLDYIPELSPLLKQQIELLKNRKDEKGKEKDGEEGEKGEKGEKLTFGKSPTILPIGGTFGDKEAEEGEEEGGEEEEEEEEEELEALVSSVMLKLNGIDSNVAPAEDDDDSEYEFIEEKQDEFDLDLDKDINTPLPKLSKPSQEHEEDKGDGGKKLKREITASDVAGSFEKKETTEIQQMLSELGVDFKFFPKRLEVYAQQALLLYQEQLVEYEQWEEGELEKKEQQLGESPDTPFEVEFPDVFTPPPLPEAEDDEDDEDKPVKFIPAVVPPGALGMPPQDQDENKEANGSSSFSSSPSPSPSPSPSSSSSSSSSPSSSSSSSSASASFTSSPPPAFSTTKTAPNAFSAASAASSSASLKGVPIKKSADDSSIISKPYISKSKIQDTPRSRSTTTWSQLDLKSLGGDLSSDVKTLRLQNLAQFSARSPSRSESLSRLIDEANRASGSVTAREPSGKKEWKAEEKKEKKRKKKDK